MPQRPLIMGILNVTPDSFSDGGQCITVDKAEQRALQMIAEGADLIDVGGESSRPGAAPVSTAIELARVIPVIERIGAVSDVCVSIDTYKAPVMRAAVSAGAGFINDIKALTEEGALMTAARLQVPICLMHMKGLPATMQDAPAYEEEEVVAINRFFSQRLDACYQAGIERTRLLLDPGFGFGKSVAHNLNLVRRLTAFQKYQLPVLLGVSRKSTLGAVVGEEVSSRVHAGLAVAVYAALQGVAIIRTHDVAATYHVLKMTEALA